MDGKSLDITQERLNQLKNLFPEIVTEGKINLDKLKEFLNDDIQDKKEFYQLNWAGKNQARKEIQKQTSATLHKITNNPHTPQTQKPHVFIEGENLEVLRILQKSYFNKIKMIYIDPPYNTGNDSFVYPDDYKENKQGYQKRAGIKDDNGNLLQDTIFQKNTKENGQFHSVWLSMMYPRLFLARNLLTEDGVIFISIDDNEASNLKLLCDEVFGEENFVADIIWHSKYTTSNDAKYVSRQHEHIFFYAKSLINFEIGLLDRTKDMDASYKNPDKDIKGDWKATPLHAKSGGENNIYTITFPNGLSWTPPKGRYPRYSKTRLLQIFNEGGLYFNKNGGIDKKTYLSEVKQGKTVGSIWSFNEVGSSHQANEQLANILDKGMFDNPKPLNLIKTCIKVANCYNDDLILDFFAGSGTTAQAVMELNEEDEGNRRCVCVQLPEPLDEKSEAYKAGYKTIADITKARIEKVIAKISKEREGKIAFADKALPIFEHYRLGESNFKVWQSEFESTEQLLEQLDIFQDSKKTESTPENMLVELLLKSGFGFDATITTIATSSHQNIYVVASKGLWIYFGVYDEFFYEQVTTSNLQRLIILDSCFGDDTSLKNFELDLKERKIDLIII